MAANQEAFLEGISAIMLPGKCLGVFSLNVLQKWEHRKRQINGMTNAITIGFTLLLLVDTSFRFHHIFENLQTNNPTDKLRDLDNILYFGSMLFVYLYQLFTHKRFNQVITEFVSSCTPISSKFRKNCRIIILIALFLGLVEEALYYRLTIEPRGKQFNQTDLLESYYTESLPHWKCISFMYNIPVAIIMGIFMASATLGWITTDVVCAAMFLGLWDKLHTLQNKINAELHEPEKLKIDKARWRSGNAWNEIRFEYIEILNLCDTIQQYTCPLIVACYVGLVSEITVDLFLWIGPIRTTDGAGDKFLEAGFPFLHYCFRVAAFTYFASNVYHKCYEILKIVVMVPKQVYSNDLELLERTMTNYPIGIKLFDSILITRRSFLAIISVIMTIEIFLLQTFMRID